MKLSIASRAITRLLPVCSVVPPLGEHWVLLLTDLYRSMSDFAGAMRREEGRRELVETFERDGGAEGREVGREVVEFWMEEWIAE